MIKSILSILTNAISIVVNVLLLAVMVKIFIWFTSVDNISFTTSKEQLTNNQSVQVVNTTIKYVDGHVGTVTIKSVKGEQE